MSRKNEDAKDDDDDDDNDDVEDDVAADDDDGGSLIRWVVEDVGSEVKDGNQIKCGDEG